LGRVRVAGKQNDSHEGEFLLLIDLAGNDSYDNVGATLEAGYVSIILDLDGDDVVTWGTEAAGPGSGTLGTGLWIDLKGNDRYHGGAIGLGSALLGSGLFWDEEGDDIYRAGALVQGVGHYGAGVFVDAAGNDRYQSDFSGQGYGGPGGIGAMIDLSGDDQYECGGRMPDPAMKRARRHREVHYLSMCQGYGFGLRPEISGGIGMLLDRKGDDSYKVDIFGQGGAYWFGLGMLIDGSGDDRYEGFEHAQGESLHLAAGFLGDWGGNDTYVGYEHAQGVGIDRAAGVLYDVAGDDSYKSHHESQGAGVKPYGVGILMDKDGDDHYGALRESQGYAKPDPRFPDSQWPIGMLLDLGGVDTFEQPYADTVDNAGRIQNRQGIAIKK
jgi:hypothetical protein